MPINFIPNDPRAQSSPPMRTKAPRPNRPATRAGFNFFGAAPEGVFAPGSPEFLFWQCREAALLSLEVWETLNGPLARWPRATPNPRRLNLLQDEGLMLNAFYDGLSLSFFHHTTGTKTTFSGASTDVVAHEAGHALLDAIRPSLFDSFATEHGAFHEALGDCMALLVAFFDRPTRQALLTPTSKLGSPNFVEATAEDLSDGVRRALGASHPAAAPRRALNNFRFQLPTTLPTSGPPALLTSEIHSFGRIFSGCFYDTVRNIFAASPTKTEAALLRAATVAGRLLIAAAQSAPEVPRFFQAVGRAMVLHDASQNGGANRAAITDAFARHNIPLGSAAMLAPRASLMGAAPRLAASARGPVVNAATVRDIRSRMGAAAKSRMNISSVDIGGEKVAKAVHFREVPLGDLSARLAGVVATTPEAMLIGTEGAKPAAMSAIPDANTTGDEVRAFVESLLKNDRIDFRGETLAASKKGGGAKAGAKAGAKKAGAVAAEELAGDRSEMPTHAVVRRGGKKELVRIRFLCRH